MHRLVLLRHGQSEWNKSNQFTGWTDVDLTDRGQAEAREAGRLLKEEGFNFDVAYTSVLKRAIRTLWLTLDEMNLMWIPVYRSWRLNEKSYGALQGMNKAETAAKYGEDQVLQWRRAYDVRPPELEESDDRHPIHERRYRGIDRGELPPTECLQDAVERFLPYWHDVIAPSIRHGNKVIISAHGNSLRALVKHLDQVPNDEIVKLNIPTGMPLVYELDDTLHPVQHYYLGDPEKVKAAMEAVANQGKAK